MSEKRKPELIFDAYYRGNNGSTCQKIVRVELYPARLWADSVPVFGKGRSTGMSVWDTRGDVYRVRVNGKWWNREGRQTITLSDFFQLFRMSVIKARKHEREKDRRSGRDFKEKK